MLSTDCAASVKGGWVAYIETTKLVTTNYTGFAQRNGFAKSLIALKEGLEAYEVSVGADLLQALVEQIDAVLNEREGFGGKYEAFSEPDLDSIIVSLWELIEELPATSEIPMGNEDLPLEFDADLLADERIRPILVPDEKPTLEEWLREYLGTGEDSTVAVIDLSLIPSDVVELVVAVMGRMIFEALQRHRRIHKKALPTTLVLEEAHAFVRYHPPGAEFQSPGEMCVRTFERIAREGRKFGLGLVLASQRPSELSPTILAQCNSFLLHRLVNDLDQSLVRKLVPDNLAGMLEDLPSLPTRPRAPSWLGRGAADPAGGPRAARG